MQKNILFWQFKAELKNDDDVIQHDHMRVHMISVTDVCTFNLWPRHLVESDILYDIWSKIIITVYIYYGLRCLDPILCGFKLYMFYIKCNLPESHCQGDIDPLHNYRSTLQQSGHLLVQSLPWFYSIFHHMDWNQTSYMRKLIFRIWSRLYRQLSFSQIKIKAWLTHYRLLCSPPQILHDAESED